MTEFNRPELFWETPRWWVTSGEDGPISRNQLIKRWRANVDLGELDSKVFDGELAVWSSALGQRDWVVADYGASGAALAWQGVTTPQPTADLWLVVSRLWHEFGDRLARYTSGLVAMADARRPVLPNGLRDSIREPARRTAPASRSLILTETPSILETRDTAEAFLADTSVRLERDFIPVLHSYIHRLSDFVNQLDEVAPDIAAIVNERIDELTIEFGDPPPEPGRELSDAARHRAGKLVEQELRKKPHLLTRHEEVIGLAAARTIQFLARRIDQGRQDVEHAGIIHRIVRQVKAEEQRRRSLVFTSLDAILDDETRAEPIDFNATDRESRTEREVDMRIIVEKVRAEVAKKIYLRLNLDGSVTPVDDFWEKDAAFAILDGLTPLDFEGPDTEILGLFGDEWSTRSPERAVSLDAKQAAAYIHSMISDAFDKVANVEDLPEVFLFRPGAKRKRNRAAIAKRLLKDAKRNANHVAPKNEEEK